MPITSSDSLLSPAVFLNGGEVISCEKRPLVAVGTPQPFKQRLWLLTPLTQLLPGSVNDELSVSGVSAESPVHPRIHGPPLDPPVKSLPMTLET